METEIQFEHGESYCCGVIFENEDELNDWIYKEADIRRNARARLRNLQFPIALLESVEVIEEDRGRGIGSSLLKSFLSATRHARHVILIVDVYEDQAIGMDLVKWYKRYGFNKIGKAGSMPLMMKGNW